MKCYSCGATASNPTGSCNTEKGDVLDCPDRQHDACANVTFVGKTKDGTPITSIVRTCAALEGQNAGCTTKKDDFGLTTFCTCKGDLCNMVGIFFEKVEQCMR